MFGAPLAHATHLCGLPSPRILMIRDARYGIVARACPWACVGRTVWKAGRVCSKWSLRWGLSLQDEGAGWSGRETLGCARCAQSRRTALSATRNITAAGKRREARVSSGVLSTTEIHSIPPVPQVSLVRTRTTSPAFAASVHFLASKRSRLQDSWRVYLAPHRVGLGNGVSLTPLCLLSGVAFCFRTHTPRAAPFLSSRTACHPTATLHAHAAPPCAACPPQPPLQGASSEPWYWMPQGQMWGLPSGR